MQNKLISRLFAILAILNAYAVLAYEVDDLGRYQEAYPNNMAVVLNHNQTVNIEVDEQTGELLIFETDYEEILYLQPASKFYTSQSIYTSEFFEDIIDIKVTIYDSRGKKNKLKDEDFRLVDSPPSSWVFHDDDKELIFDLQALGEGCRTLIEYTKRVKRPQFFDVFHFMSIYPIENSTVEIVRPSNVELKFYEQKMSGYDVKREQLDLKKDVVMSKWEMHQLKEYATESGSTNIKNHIPHLIAQILSYEAGGEKIALIGSAKELHGFFQEFLLLSERNYQRSDDKLSVSKNKVMEDLVDSMTVGMTSELQKMDTIFRWVQANIKYIAFEDGINGYVPRACSSVMKNRFGDCKDMGNLLVEMLNHASVSGAKVAWVGTRDIPYLMSEIPTPLACNHVICVVDKGDGSYYYLDATSAEGSYLLPPQSVQGKELLIHNDIDDFTIFKVPAVNASKNYLKSVIRYHWDDDDDSLRGTGVDHFGGYERERKTYTLNNLDDEGLFGYIKEVTLGGYNRFALMDFDIQNLKSKDEELLISYDFSVDNLFIKLDNELILNPTLFKPRISQYNTEDHKLTRQKENHRLIDYTFEFQIPTGYEVKFLPQGNEYNHALFNYVSSFKIVDDVLQVNHTYQYNLLEIPTDLYGEWNAFSDAINSATIQNIILEKKN